MDILITVKSSVKKLVGAQDLPDKCQRLPGTWGGLE
jgi:hypothetical protein